MLFFTSICSPLSCCISSTGTGAYKLENFKEWDRGFDFYAPQTFLDEKGRRILIAWAGIPDEKGYTNPTTKDGWQHMLTMPRELKWKNGMVF